MRQELKDTGAGFQGGQPLGAVVVDNLRNMQQKVAAIQGALEHVKSVASARFLDLNAANILSFEQDVTRTLVCSERNAGNKNK